MGERRRAAIVVRWWSIIRALHAAPRGLTAQELAEQVGVGRSQLYRDLNALDASGVSIARWSVNGTVRLRLAEPALPPLAPTPLQIAALRVARSALAPLAGTALLDELDALLAPYAHQPVRAARVDVPVAPPAHDEAVARTVERAIAERRRLAFDYQPADAPVPSPRKVDPLVLRLHDEQLYLAAYAPHRGEPRVYKLSRMTRASLLDERADDHRVDLDELFAHAVGIWRDTPVDIEVALSPRAARLAREHPLVDTQSLVLHDDGSATLRARVAGLIETSRWVLAHGPDAEVKAPPELRELVHRVLRESVGNYEARGARS